jgi:hypothetical protein
LQCAHWVYWWVLSRTQTLLTKIRQVCNEIRDIRLDAQSHQDINKYVHFVNKKHTRGEHIINKINIQRQREDSIVNNHKTEREGIHGKEHGGYNHSSGKSPTYLKDAGSNTYNHDDCEEHPTQTLSRLTPERLKISHTSSLDPSELALTPVESPPSSPALFQSSSLSDPSLSSSLLFPDSEVTSSRGGTMSDSRLDSVLAGRLGDPVEPRDLGKVVLQWTAKEDPHSTLPTEDEQARPELQKYECGYSHTCPPNC